MKRVSYNLKKTVEPPFMARRPIAWMFTGARLPNPGERVIWSAPNGSYVDGEYKGRDHWEQDPDEQHPESRRVAYTPSIWRPIG